MAEYRDEYIFIEGRIVASMSTHILISGTKPACWLKNTAFLCPVCGEVWARRVFRDPPLSGWLASLRPCVQHSGGGVLIHAADLVQLINPSWDFLASQLLAGALNDS